MKKWQKIAIFGSLLFVFSVSLFLVKNPIQAQAPQSFLCPAYQTDIQDAARDVGLSTECPEQSPESIIDAILSRETICGTLRLNTPTQKSCEDLRTNRCNAGVITDKDLCTPAAKEKRCKDYQNALTPVCKSAGLSPAQCITSPDYGMGIAQFQPTTWDEYFRGKKFEKFKDYGLSGYPNPWNPKTAIYAMATKLSEDGFCVDKDRAISLYNGGTKNQRYIDEIYHLARSASAAFKNLYEEMTKKLAELWNYKRDLEIKYPEIWGIKPEKVDIGIELYVKYLIGFVFIASGILLLGLLIQVGILFLTSSGEPTKTIEARKKLFLAFAGIILLFAAYILLNYINPQLLIFKLSEINSPFNPVITSPLPAISSEAEKSKISEGISLGQALERGLWSEANTSGMKIELQGFEGFLYQDISVNPRFERISDLNKYLKSLTEDCQCGNIKALCTKPADWSLPVGCNGDPCSGDIRKKIAQALGLNKEKVRGLLDWQKKLLEYKTSFQEELRKLSSSEEEMMNCQAQMGGLSDYHEYLNENEPYNEIPSGDWKLSEILNYYSSQADPLSFYCLAGGSILEAKPEGSSVVRYSGLTCPQEIKLGEEISENRELAILAIVKLEALNYWIEKMAEEIKNMSDLVSQCNEQGCTATCACIPNPCYKQPNPICAPVAGSRCLQAVGGCTGNPCPKVQIGQAVEEIKKIEEEIFLGLKELNSVFPRALDLLSQEDEEEAPFSLVNLRKKVFNCKDGGLKLFGCQEVIGNNGPEGVITQCHPENFYCCFPPENPPEPEETPSLQYPPLYVPPTHRKEFQPLPAINDCPEGWTCSNEVKNFNQYDEASPPLKEFLSCLREKLDTFQKEKEIDPALGKITSISDSKLQRGALPGTCNWTLGPLVSGGCKYTYQKLKQGKESVSCHYGGTNCRAGELSYAVNISLESPSEKRYVGDIMRGAKECEPRLFADIEEGGQSLHLSLGLIYGCDCQ